ncbi:MAG: DUF6602 domain-containing protein [Bacteroidota bacterium]|jgi:hypothetical protein
MPNDIYKKLLLDKVRAFLKESRTIEGISHLGLRGEIRESGIGKLISSLLPSEWDIGTGKIIDSEGKQSPQVDLLIYFKKVFPPIFFSEKLGLFPIESCGFAFEVKSTATATEIKKTVKNFNVLKSLQIQTPFHETPIVYQMRPIRVLFALQSDLKKGDEFQRYKKLDPEYLENPAVEILCVLNKGLWIHRAESRNTSPHWEFYDSDKNQRELLHFFGLMINQLISMTTDGSIDMKGYFFELIERLPKGIER